MSNSNMVSYTHLSPNNYGTRDRKIVGVTPHVIVGQLTAKDGCDWFAKPSAKSSANYVIGRNGEVGMSVPENMAAWTSSNRANDMSHVTIECASDKTHPYAINKQVYDTLVKLIADIHIRNNLGLVTWKGDKTLIDHPELQNMTVHRWFKNKACPGDYVYARLGDIADAANKLIIQNGNVKKEDPVDPKPDIGTPAFVEPFMIRVLVDDLNIRSTPTTTEDNIKGVIPKGVYTIVCTRNDWGKLKSGAGWIYIGNSKYCERVASKEVRVTIDNLNIRSGPGVAFEPVGVTGKGTFHILEVVNGFGKLSSGAGWISMEFTESL